MAKPGYDPTVAPDGARVAYLVGTTTQTQLRTVPIGGGASRIIYSTSGELESPEWVGSRIYFVEYTGLGYDGRKNVRIMSVNPDGSSPRTERSLPSHHVGLSITPGNDEIFFYRSHDGAFRYYDIRPTGQLGSTILSGSGYSKGWSSISAVDLDGDGRDEMFFYRATDGAFRYYRIRPDGQLQSLILGGNGYSKGWDSITAVDLDGDGQDEMMFYRSTDGAFRYYNITKSAGLVPILSGSGYTKNWDVITAVDLDGDGQDELHFYKSNGTYRYYDVRPNGQIGSPLLSGTGYSSGWSTITAVDLDGS